MVNNLNTGEPQTLACGGISSLRNNKDGGNDHKDPLRDEDKACPVQVSPLFTDRNYTVTCARCD